MRGFDTTGSFSSGDNPKNSGLTGTSDGTSIGAPILTTTEATFPSSPILSFNVFTPESVSIVTVVLLVRPLSYTYLPTQRIPLPHILPCEPSALYISMKKSAFSEGLIRISPSEPIPNLTSLTLTAISTGLLTATSVQSTYM